MALTNCAPYFSARQVPVTVSDSLGDLLFYAGIFNYSGYNHGIVYDRNHQAMPNGQNLPTYWGTMQNYLAIQKLDDDSSYYLFTMDGHYDPSFNPNPKGLTYSIINMRLNGGYGDIVSTQKAVQVPGAGITRDMLAGTRHLNNRDVWITVRDYNNSYSYLTYLITSSGINTVPVISNSLLKLPYYPYPGTLNPSMIRFSPDGSRVACIYTDTLEFCQFNSLTGQITPLFRIHYIGANSPGGEFSIDNHFLYLNGQATGIYQFDATLTDSALFAQSKILITTNASSEAWLQRGANNKIYIADWETDSLGVINNPSVQGTGCNYQRSIVPLAGNICMAGLPQFVQRYYLYMSQSGQCVTDSVNFSYLTWPPADSIYWNFGDPASGSSNISHVIHPKHKFSSAGSYNVTLILRHEDKRFDTVIQSISIKPSPAPMLGPDQTICSDDSVTFDAGACVGCTYIWSNITGGLPNIGTNQTYTAKTTAQYMVTVTNSFGCIGRDTVNLLVTPAPVVTNNPLTKTICSGENTNISLTSNVPGTIFHWIPSLISGNITGFGVDSGTVINQVLINNLATPGTIKYSITPKIGNCIGTPVDFVVIVNPGDSAKVVIVAMVNNVCAGTPVTFTATPTNPGTNPSYQWKANGINAGGNNTTFMYTPLNGDQVYCTMTSSISTCISNNPATSNTIIMIVNPNLPVGVTVSPSSNNICAGTMVTLTANPTYPGTSPTYQWKVNGLIVGTNSPTYSYIPLNNDVVTCTLTSSETCTQGNPAISNPVTMTVNYQLNVSVNISASSNPFCIGSSVAFTATAANPGTTPVYQWKVNGINAGTNSPTFAYSPVSGDVVSCVLTSSVACPLVNPVTSNTITLTGNTGLPAGVSIAANPNPFCPGTSVTFTATPSNGGTNPSYQWKVNGANAGTNSPAFSYNAANNDSVRCVMTSNLACVSGNPTTSNKIILSGTLAPIVTFTTCFDTITKLNAKPIKLKGGIPLNGTYSGPGVAGGIFNPATAGIGTKTITYTYSNAVLCSASKTKTIIVQTATAFTCGNNLTDIRDGKSYPTVQIGSQCWMAANLNYGNPVSSIQHQRDNCVNEKYCYQDLSANCAVRGANYQWDEIMRYDDTPGLQGLCPPGWHVPTEAEWNTLFANWTNSGFAGSPLKYSGYSGFNALLSGVNHFNRQWDFNNFATFLWSSTPYGPYKAWAHGMNDYNPSVSVYPASRANAFSVRCLKDN